MGYIILLVILIALMLWSYNRDKKSDKKQLQKEAKIDAIIKKLGISEQEIEDNDKDHK
jgi:nitric oxide reductase large subunit